MNIEPIHEIPADELQHALDTAREHIEWELKSDSDCVLKTLADSIKKSLVFLFPKFDELIFEIIDAKEASYAMSWATGYFPLGEGVKALQKIYGVLHYYETPDDFKEMEAAVKDYARIAHHYFHDDKMQKDAPFVDAGLKYFDQKEKAAEYGRKGGKAPKGSEDILESIISKLKEHPNRYSAETLWRHYRRYHHGEENVDEYCVYFKEDYTGQDRDELIDGDGRRITFHTFRGYVAQARKDIKEKIVAQ